jgi:ATP-dependent Lhr-like helicase
MDDLIEQHLETLLDTTNLETDLEQALNLSELCRRRFRSIAQVAGLLVQGFPGKSKTTGQLQISGSLLWEVFSKHEPSNLLLRQAQREVLQEQLELPRLHKALERIRRGETLHCPTPRPGPLAFPLLAERLGSRLTNESLQERLQRMIDSANKAEL